MLDIQHGTVSFSRWVISGYTFHWVEGQVFFPEYPLEMKKYGAAASRGGPVRLSKNPHSQQLRMGGFCA
ncbi:MAG: hypothetical protein ACI4OU_01245, partial [Candidatus Enterenecus sp.]